MSNGGLVYLLGIGKGSVLPGLGARRRTENSCEESKGSVCGRNGNSKRGGEAVECLEGTCRWGSRGVKQAESDSVKVDDHSNSGLVVSVRLLPLGESIDQGVCIPRAVRGDSEPDVLLGNGVQIKLGDDAYKIVRHLSG